MKFVLTLALLSMFVAVPADAQVRAQLKQKQAKQRQAKQNQVDAIERFLAMSPAERRQALAQLPPQRQRQILQRLNALELLSDDERTLLRGRQQAFSAMTFDRRQAVRAELQNLRGMAREDRRKRLDGDDVRQNFSAEERQLLNDVFGPPGEREE